MSVTVGARYGRLVVVGKSPKRTGRKTHWVCNCDCGAERVIVGYSLHSGHTVSCGCSGGKLKHGHGRLDARTPEYETWRSMMRRCYSETRADYHHYGGRGIHVCERWHTFENFFADMGPRPPGKSIDRFPDNDGNYEPGNCRWATAKEQAANRRERRRAA